MLAAGAAIPSRPRILAGAFLQQQFVMISAFAEHFRTTFRTRRFLAGDALPVLCPLSALGTDTPHPLPHIVPVPLYPELHPVRRKRDNLSPDGKVAVSVSTSKYVMLSGATINREMTISGKGGLTTAHDP